MNTLFSNPNGAEESWACYFWSQGYYFINSWSENHKWYVLAFFQMMCKIHTWVCIYRLELWYKVDGSYVTRFLNQTPRFNWYVVQWGWKSEHHIKTRVEMRLDYTFKFEQLLYTQWWIQMIWPLNLVKNSTNMYSW